MSEKKLGKKTGEIVIQFYSENTIILNISENVTAKEIVSANELLISMAEDFSERYPKFVDKTIVEMF